LVADMPNEYIYEPWTAPLSIQEKAHCIIGRDYPKPGHFSLHTISVSSSYSFVTVRIPWMPDVCCQFTNDLGDSAIY